MSETQLPQQLEQAVSLNLFNREQAEKLLFNGNNGEFGTNTPVENWTGDYNDFNPVVHLVSPAGMQYLITEYHEENGTFFALCDLGAGFPEIGSTSAQELLERHNWFIPNHEWKASKTLQEYARIARGEQRIVA